MELFKPQLHALQPADAERIEEGTGVRRIDHVAGAFGLDHGRRLLGGAAAGADQVVHAGPGAGQIVAQHPGAAAMGADIRCHVGQDHGRGVAGFVPGPPRP